MGDLYLVLGVDRDATRAEIRRAYRRLARRLHPHINPGDPVAARRFEEVLRAFEVLDDPDRRRHYDEQGPPRSEEAPAATTAFEGFDFSVRAEAAQAATFTELFADLFVGSQHGDDVPERGADLHVTLSVPFMDAMVGATRAATVTRAVSCPACGGEGAHGDGRAPCPTCLGRGSLRGVRGHMVFSRACHACAGSGRDRPQACPGCRGQGLAYRTEMLRVQVPVGAADGLLVRVPGQGNAGRHGGPPGDLLVTVRVEPHPYYCRVGQDLHLTLPVSVYEAALGAHVTVPTLTGGARIRIPPGTQAGRRFRIRGRGIPLGGDVRGDVVVETQLVLPPLADERSRALMRELAALHGDDVRKAFEA